MTELVSELVKRNGPNTATELAIALARQHFAVLSAAAQAINVPVAELLASLELQRLAELEEGD